MKLYTQIYSSNAQRENVLEVPFTDYINGGEPGESSPIDLPIPEDLKGQSLQVLSWSVVQNFSGAGFRIIIFNDSGAWKAHTELAGAGDSNFSRTIAFQVTFLMV